MKKSRYFALPLVLLVIAGGVIFGALLTFEYRENLALIEQNRALLNSTADRTLRLYIDELTRELPDSVAALRENWRDHGGEVYGFADGIQVFPFLQNVEMPARFTALWQCYTTDCQLPNPVSHSAERRAIVEKTRRAAAKRDDDNLRRHLGELLTHIQNFRLSSLEEMVSRLALFAGENELRWSPDAVRALLLDGWRGNKQHVDAVLDLLFSADESYNPQDLDSVLAEIEGIAERYNISLDAIPKYRNRPHQSIQLRFPSEGGVWIQEQRWLVFSLNTREILATSINLSQYADDVEALLKSQGLLQETDRILLDNNAQVLDINADVFRVQSGVLEKKRAQQHRYYFIKMLLLFILMLLLLLASYAVESHINRKHAFVQMREDFINLISHELKTPLASIRLMTETLAKRLRQGLDPRDYTSRILMESDRLQMMVENILSFSKLDEATQNHPGEVVNIKEVVNAVCEEFDNDGNRAIRFTIDIPDTVKIKINALLFSLVIKNLVSNAIKYNEHDSVEVAMTFDERNSSLFFYDNGVGVDPARWERVFDKFYREGAARKQGLGLGLALSRAIMRRYGGDLMIATSGSEGTRWRILLGTSWTKS